MCAIFGFAGQTRKGQWRQTHDLLTALFLESQSRGKDASGFAATRSPYANSNRIGGVCSKAPLRAVDFVRTNAAWRQLQHQRCSAIIGHTRWATHGSPAFNSNNHPHYANGMYLVHNGIISQHVEIADRLGIQLSTDCDSELLMGVVEMSDHPVEGLANCLSECSGSMAIAVLDPQREIIALARNNGRPTYVVRLKNDTRTFFGSTEGILLSAFRRVLGPSVSSKIDFLMPLADGVVHVLRVDGSLQTALGRPSLTG